MRDDRLGAAAAVGAADAAAPVLAMDQPSVGAERVAVHELRVVDHHLDVTVGVPAEQTAVRDVGPDEAVARRVPDRALAVQGSLVEFKQLRVGG